MINSIFKNNFLLFDISQQKSLIEDFLNQWSDIFDSKPENYGSLYHSFGSEKAIEQDLPDLKDFYQFSIKNADTQLINNTNEMILAILNNIARPIMLEVLSNTKIDASLLDIDKSVVRVSRYMKLIDENIVVNHPHLDIDLFTLVLPPTSSGLMLEIDNEWCLMDEDKSKSILMTGEMIERLSKGTVKSMRHKVEIQKGVGKRISISIFINANFGDNDNYKSEREFYEKRLNDVRIN